MTKMKMFKILRDAGWTIEPGYNKHNYKVTSPQAWEYYWFPASGFFQGIGHAGRGFGFKNLLSNGEKKERAAL